jgi:hypothetical protein
MSDLRPARRLVFRRLVLIAAACAVLSYPASRHGLFEWPRAYDPLAVPNLAEPPGFLTQWQMKLVDQDPQNCAAAFRLAGKAVALKPEKRASSACVVTGSISVWDFSVAKIKPEDMRCAVAARLYQWERHSLQVAARRELGEGIAEILHFGSFSCRTIRGGSSMSEHATANAFDISGFKTRSGKLISVRRDWGKPTAEGLFLLAARNGLCNWFNATLSPDYNADHADHFHVDMGWWRTCR